MTDWKETTLGGVARNASRSFDFSSKEEVIFVNTGDVLAGKFLHRNYSKKEGLPGQAKKAIRKGDILFSEIRPENKRFALVDFDTDEYVVSTKFMVIERNDKIDPKFLYIVLTSNQTLQEFQVIAESRSGTFPQITFDSIANFPILLPPLEEQKEIAGVLSSLDDKIELLRKENETLENIAQTIFKEWFVNFNFPNTEGEPYKSSNGRTIDSELGEIPEGWRVGKLGDVLSLEYGKALKEEDRTGRGYPVLGSNGIVGYHEKFLVEGDGIVVGRKGTMGAIVWVEDNFYPIDTTFYVQDKLGIDKLFFHYLLLLRQDLERVGSDSAVPGLNRNSAYVIDAVIPNIDVVGSFHKIIEPIFSEIKNNNSQIQTLSRLRDTLLPKLMSGGVRIGDS